MGEVSFSRPAFKYAEASPLEFAAGAAEMDFGLSPAIVESLTEVIAERDLGYLDDFLARKVRDSCVSWMAQEYNWEIKSDWVQLVPDTAGAISVVQEILGRFSNAVIYPSPLYARLWRTAESLGMRAVPVPLIAGVRRYEYDVAGFERALSATRNPIVVLCNPHNPTGCVALREELEALSAIVHRHNGTVISDEVHSPLTFSSSRHVPYASVSEEARLHTITVVSTSKGWNTSGLKCAQVIMGNDIHRALWDQSERAGLLVNSTSRLGAVAANAAYRDQSSWRSQVVDILETNAQRLDEWTNGFLGISMIPPEASFLAWLALNVDETDRHRDTAEAFSAAGIYVQAGSMFEPSDSRHVRLNYALSSERFLPMLRAAEQRFRGP